MADTNNLFNNPYHHDLRRSRVLCYRRLEGIILLHVGEMSQNH